MDLQEALDLKNVPLHKLIRARFEAERDEDDMAELHLSVEIEKREVANVAKRKAFDTKIKAIVDANK